MIWLLDPFGKLIAKAFHQSGPFPNASLELPPTIYKMSQKFNHEPTQYAFYDVCLVFFRLSAFLYKK